jgi:hypothetical protein
MEKHIEYVCFVEQRPFSYLDFLEFNVDGKPHHMTHGTFRNKISVLIKSGKVEWLCDSPQGFYTLKESGQDTNTIANDNHTGVNHLNGVKRLNHISYKDKITNQSRELVDEIIFNDQSSRFENPRIITNSPLYRYIKSIPFGQRSIHDIRLRFEASAIWNKVVTCLSSHVDNYDIKEINLHGLKIDNRSKDISFSPIRIDNLYVNVRIHKTDRVSVIIACSYTPVVLDVEGIQRLSKALSLIQKELTRLVLGIENDIVNVVARKKWNCLKLENQNVHTTGTPPHVESTTTPVIPKFMDWIVTMWHFGADAIHEYSGEKFNCTWKLAQDIVVRIYSRKWKMQENESNKIHKIKGGGNTSGRPRIRIERQEYPKVTLQKALRDKCLKLEEEIGK